MSVELAAILIMVALLVSLAIGVPVAFALLSVGLLFALLLIGPSGLYFFYTAAWHQVTSQVMLAIPLFVLMSELLEFSGIGNTLFEVTYKWMGGLRGGLAVGVVGACTILAAITGLGASGVLIMGVLAIPAMYKHGYDKKLVLGCIPAASCLGPIIPPSVYMIVLAMMAEESVGKVFMGGVAPGLLISAMFCTYIVVRSYIQPHYAPGVPIEERASWREKIVLLRGVVLPFVLIVAVLGTIYGGIATPTEAAAIGAVGAFLIAVIHRQLTWQKLKKSVTSSLLLTSLIMWVAIGGTLFAGVLRASGAASVVQEFMIQLPLNGPGLVSVMLLIALVLGMFMDGLAIIMISVPVFVPLLPAIGIDVVYFVVLYTIAIVIGVITPPFAMNLFLLKGVAPNEKLSDIYRASVPFVIIMVIALMLAVIFPDIIMWLPGRMK